MSTALRWVLEDGFELPLRPLAVTGVGVAVHAGTAVAASPLALLRGARPADAPELHALLDGFARQGLLLPRTPEQVCRHIREFTVAVDARGIVGCAGLRLYSPRLAEVCGLAVAERCHGQGLGRSLVEAVVAEAGQLGIRRVFALTLQEGFFQRQGFRIEPIATLPEKIAADCAGCARRTTCREIAVIRDLDF